MYINMQEPHSECYDYALHYLYRYPKSYRDMQAKLLEKQYTSDEVQETMDYLVYKGYIDDAKYAESYLTSECINK
jgi:SOS response regulatory protein OraA/RecX